jgi:hypothetical protein
MARRPEGPADRREGSKRPDRHPAQEQGKFDARESTPRSERPSEPDSWRAVVRSDYDYPDDLADLNRRDRRRAQKDWRRDDHAQRMAWLRNQRQAEPTSPAAIVALVLLVAIVILGIGGGLPRLLKGDKTSNDAPVGLLTPGPSVVGQPTEPAEPGGSDSAVPSTDPLPTDSPPPPQSQRPSSADFGSATGIVEAWAQAFYSRNPAIESYPELVAKCSRYMTQELAESFSSAGDSTYEVLKADGGSSSVLAAPVSAPQVGAAPVDTPTRISRFVKITINITGKKPSKIDVPLLVTLVRQNAQWVISDVSGGTGP